MLDNRQESYRIGWTILAAYAALLLPLLSLQSLWLDELMEVVATAGLPLRDVVAGYAAHSAGQSPLSAVEQSMVIGLLGYSTFAARLPAALASVIGAAGMLALARHSGFRRPWLALLLFVSFPLVLRYGAEARPYAQALCIAVWLDVLFLKIAHQPAPRFLIMYSALLAVGLYTQPYVLFVAVAQCLFLAARKSWALLLPMAAVIVVAGCAYLPWYLHSRDFWRQEVNASQLHFHWQAKLSLLIPRELLGSGYAGTLAVVVLGVYGLSYLRARHSDRLWWIALVVAPLGLAILADLVFDYFFAIRQVIIVLPPLAIAAAAGIERLRDEKGARLAAAIAALLLLLNFGYAARWFTKPREDWAAAARTLRRAAASGACFLALPPGSNVYYEFFEPTLRGRECAPATLDKQFRVAVAVSPYLIDRNSVLDAEAKLQAAHFHTFDKASGQPGVSVYERR